MKKIMTAVLFVLVSSMPVLAMADNTTNAPMSVQMSTDGLVAADSLAGDNSAISADQVQADLVIARVACYARNLRGERFEEIGRFTEETQRRAVEKCYRYGSRRCFAEGCRVI